MTGFARAAGRDSTGAAGRDSTGAGGRDSVAAGARDAATSWTWEIRSVNGRGLELRLKLPAGFDSLEPALRAVAAARLARGTIQASLTLARDEQAGVTVDRPLLRLLIAEARAMMEALPGAPPPRIETLMTLPGVVRRAMAEELAPSEALLAAAARDFDAALADLARMRAAEGARLADILTALLDRVEMLQGQAASQAALQPDQQRARMAELLQRLLGDAHAVPADRLAQEVALLATKSDVTEEIDRLASHIAAARGLLAAGGPIGRQLDFLVQEFMREANTLCSKSASTGLTAAGLQLKATIEQIREQVQNVE